MRKIAAYILALCIAVLLAGCGNHSGENDKDVLHLGLDAEVLEIDADKRYIYVKGLDATNDYFGERCLIDCNKALDTYKVFYADQTEPESVLEDISFRDLHVGDTVVLAAYENELNCPEDGAITVEQIQLNRTTAELPVSETSDVPYYYSEALNIRIKYPESLQGIVAMSDGMSYEYFLSDRAEPIKCVYLYPAIDDSFDQDSIIGQIYWLPTGTLGPEASFGKCVTLLALEDGSRCVCHLPMSAKLGYEAVDCTIPNKWDMWNIYHSVEESILSGEFEVEVLEK